MYEDGDDKHFFLRLVITYLNDMRRKIKVILSIFIALGCAAIGYHLIKIVRIIR